MGDVSKMNRSLTSVRFGKSEIEDLGYVAQMGEIDCKGDH